RTTGSLGGQIGRQVLPGEQGLQVIRQKQTLRAAAALVVVHDAALEALVDEVVVRGIVRRLARRRAPDFEIQQTQDVRFGRTADIRADCVEEGLLEVDRLPVKRVSGVGANEGED